MKNVALSFLFLLAVHPCFSQKQEENQDLKAVRTIMSQQEKAWNEGDIPSFMEGYWQNENLVFTGSKGPTYGYLNTLERYKKSYPDQAAMGKLHFDLLFLKQWDENTIQVVGKFTLVRAQDTPTGHFTLLFRKMEGAWKIVSDHSS